MKGTLLADVGGTHARFAIHRGPTTGAVHSLEVTAYPTMADAVRSFLGTLGDAGAIDAAVIAVAGPVEDGRCVLTNSSWIADAQALEREFGIPNVRIVNDVEAAAWGLPRLAPGDSRLFGPDSAVDGAPRALLSPGTGLGMACFLGGAPQPRVIASEGGHATLAATTAREEALIGYLRQKFGHVSAERVLSGDGLVNLYRAITAIEGRVLVPRTAPEITRAGREGACSACRSALDAFCDFLGAVAGDVALCFGARGGVYLGGGIVPKMADHLPLTKFRERFDTKGRLGAYLSKIPVRVIVRPEPAFLGLAALAMTPGSEAHG